MNFDQQLKLPKYPKISEALDRIPMGNNSLQIRGAEEIVLLEGSSFVNSLTNLLDGSRSINEIVNALYSLWEQQTDSAVIEALPNTVKENSKLEIRKKILELLLDLYMNGLLEVRPH